MRAQLWVSKAQVCRGEGGAGAGGVQSVCPTGEDLSVYEETRVLPAKVG
jgi:hypothetical protein